MSTSWANQGAARTVDWLSWANQGAARTVDWLCPAQYYVFLLDFVFLMYQPLRFDTILFFFFSRMYEYDQSKDP